MEAREANKGRCSMTNGRTPSMTRRAFLGVVGTGATAAIAGSLSVGGRAAHAQAPTKGGTLRILQTEPAVGFNPVLEGGNWPQTQRMVYNGLTDFGLKGEIVPGLAQRWTISPERYLHVPLDTRGRVSRRQG